MKHAVTIARFLFGLPLVAFGVMGFVQVMPDPQAFWDKQEGFAPEAAQLILTFWDSGFLMPAVCAVHLFAGLLVVINRFVPLALVIHFPVSTMMVLFHLTLDFKTGAFAYLIFALNLYLMAAYRESYGALLSAKPEVEPDPDLTQ